MGVLYGMEHLLRHSLPFLYGGDMIAEGQVRPDRVTYNGLPWKYAAGTPNILGVIVSAQALRLQVDLVVPGHRPFFGTNTTLPRLLVRESVGSSPFAMAEALDRRGVESRAGCHCATLAPHELGLDPPATCRLSLYLYNNGEDSPESAGRSLLWPMRFSPAPDPR